MHTDSANIQYMLIGVLSRTYRAESVEVQLAAKTAELEASQRRLADLESDLVEMTVSNETYRAELAALGTKV